MIFHCIVYFGERENISYFKLHHVSWLYNELPGGQDVVCFVFFLIWPVEME